MDLSDQAAVGEYLTETDQAWLSQHASVCSKCAAEKQLYASLGGAIGHPEMLLASSMLSVAPVRRTCSRRRVYLGLGLAASVALAVAGSMVLRGPRLSKSLSSPAPQAQVVLASGEAHLGLAPAEAGQRIPPGQRLSTGPGFACMGIADSVDVCLDNSSAAIFALGDPNQILVYLEKGTLMARLDHQPAGHKLLVRTATAEVQAVGTRFSVRLADDGETRVRLHEGRLALRAAGRISTALAAPAQADIADDIRVAPIAPAAAGQDRLLADLVAVTPRAGGASLMISSTPTGADVLLDHVAIGKTPLSVFLAAAAHIRVSLPGYEPVSDWIACEACGRENGGHGRIARTYTLAALAPPPPSEAPSHLQHAARHTPPHELLAKAQSLRASGQHKACAQLYRRLQSEFPASEEARVSMVSLGELELVGNKAPVAALAAFNAYLRLGGPLEREARFGKIRALRALDRREEADAEATRFLRDYPTSIQAATVRNSADGK